MAEKRPNVFQTKESFVPITNPNVEAQPEAPKISYAVKKTEAVKQAYDYNSPDIIKEEGIDITNGLEAMRKRTEEQLKLRDEQLKKNQEQTKKYETQLHEAEERKSKPEPQKVLKTEIKSPIANAKKIPNINMSNVDPRIVELSQPQLNAPYDIIPLPSEGKIYKNKKPKLKIAFLTTADEEILTAPNLLNSGEFLEVLINRKLLDTDIRYRDLHVGDRNAIMLWLRSTSYGEMYPVTILDRDDNPFDTQIDLNNLKINKLKADPDAEGLFDFILPVTKIPIKFRLLNVGDIDDIEKLVQEDLDNNVIENKTSTYNLQRQIIQVGDVRDEDEIKDFITTMRIADSDKLRTYIESIESGVDLNIEIETPRGGSIKTFLPLNVRFFWPKLSI